MRYIYLIEATEKGYRQINGALDHCTKAVVVSKSEFFARKYASESCKDEGSDFWLTPEMTKCVILGTSNKLCPKGVVSQEVRGF